jgi:hypothetical protein
MNLRPIHVEETDPEQAAIAREWVANVIQKLGITAIVLFVAMIATYFVTSH